MLVANRPITSSISNKRSISIHSCSITNSYPIDLFLAQTNGKKISPNWWSCTTHDHISEKYLRIEQSAIMSKLPFSPLFLNKEANVKQWYVMIYTIPNK